MMQTNLQKVFYGIMIVLIAILMFNLFTTMQLTSDLNAQITEANKPIELPKIQLTIINTSCTECTQISDVVELIKSLDIEITNETILENTSEQSAELIGSYGLKQLPAIIIEGEISKINLADFRESNNALIYDSAPAPYENPVTGEIIGRIKVIIIEDVNCSVCSDISFLIDNLKQNRVFIADEENIDYNTPKGQELIIQKQITKLPALLISENISAYPRIHQGLTQANFEVSDGFYVIETSIPYVEIETGKIRGIVDVIYLQDSNCSECYDVMIHKQILASMNVKINSEETVEINSVRGQELIADFNITKIPTIILQGDVEAYPQVEQLWLEQLGTKEEKGYVFRNLEALGDVQFIELD